VIVLKDEQMTALLAQDLEDYFQRFVEAYQQRLFGFVIRRVSNAQDAEDIVQEAFLRAYHALADYPPERIVALKVTPWLFKIALNICYRHMGRNGLALTPLDDSDESPYLDIEGDSEEQPEIALEDAERRRELNAQLAELPEHYREALTCYYFEDLSYPEIAELLNRPVGTVKSHIHRGTRLLRRQFEAQKEH
jgi:RNA polymerase sigma-70 factor (ECF subfamily)